MSLAAELRAEQARKQLTSHTLAQTLGISTRTVARKTHGDSPITWEELKQFAQALNITASELVRRAEQNREGQEE